MYDKLNIIVPTRSNRAWLVPVAATAKKKTIWSNKCGFR